MINKLIPNRLSKGDTIGIISPSLPVISAFEANYELGKKELLSIGFRILEAPNVKKVKWWSGGTPQDRASDINSMFANPDVKAIISQNGGYSAVSVLEYVDYEIVQNNPKPFIGFSDITNFHSAFYTKTGLVGFHMDLLTYSLGWLWNLEDFSNKEIAKELFVKALTSPEPFGDLPQITKWESWRTGKAKGKLFGGNLSMLSTIIGTEYFPSVTDLEGAILFWEIDNADLYRIERCLTEFKYNGVFDVISGMIVGKLPDMKKLPFEGIEHPTAKQLVLSILESYNFPIIGEVDFGHKTANVPMFVGLEASMDSDNLKISVLESALK